MKITTDTKRWFLTALMVAGFYGLLQFLNRTKEPFASTASASTASATTASATTETSPALVLIGDSILNNSSYVAQDESVEYLLRQKKGGDRIVFLAEDNAFMHNVLQTQVPKIPTGTNAKTHIFVSAGGNDILDTIATFSISTEEIQHLFDKYKQLILAVQTKCPTSHLHLFNLYYPTSTLLKPYYKYIDAWNLLLRDFVSQSNNTLQEFPLSKLCFIDLDFVHTIEPSAVCSKKIVQSIISSVTAVAT